MEKPVMAQKGPYMVKVESGKKYFFCRCGKSSSQPFCNGAHKGTTFTPQEFSPAQSKTVALCGCKGSSNLPYCDGTHNNF